MAPENSRTFFAPQLYIPGDVSDLRFYTDGLGAVELRRFSNDDGTIHVSELSYQGSIFHLHEERPEKNQLAPGQKGGVTCIIGLFVDDVDEVMERAKAAGATIIHPAKDYEYGYRQGEFRDPFGHLWLIEKKIS